MNRQMNGHGNPPMYVYHRAPIAPQTQHGAALVTALIMLLVLTVVGVSSLGTTVLEERMARNSREYQLALQAAESALREGERLIAADPGDVTDSTSILFKICNGNTATCTYAPATLPATGDNPGDACPSGLCTPKEHGYDYVAGYSQDRWEYGASLTVWCDPDASSCQDTYQTYPYASDLDIATAPQYIIEFLGYQKTGDWSVCDTDQDGANDDPQYSDEWPYCQNDPGQLYRITALATTKVAGSNRGGARVMLQSTYLKSSN